MKTRVSVVVALVVAVGGTIGAGRSEAALVTAAFGFPTPTKVVTFDQFAGLGYNFTVGPVDVGGLVGEPITLTISNVSNVGSSGSVLGQGVYVLSGNGTWGNNGQTYFGLNGPISTFDPTPAATFSFAAPVAAVGGFLNYSPVFFGPAVIEALGAGNVVLESYNLVTAAPISTPNGVNAGAFRGILRATNDIVGFRLAGAYLVMDDMTFGRATTAVVPEPATLASAGLALAVLAGARLRRRTRRHAHEDESMPPGRLDQEIRNQCT